jgi:hypothetical protein
VEEKGRFVVGALSWSGLVSAIILQRLYSEPGLQTGDLLLVFLASVFAGAVLGLMENIILGFALSLSISGIIVVGVLALPSALDVTGPLYQQVALEQSLSLAVEAFLPFTVMIILVGGVVGGIVAERIGLS